MIRNLKVLGLALVAVFAMSAVAASAASAAGSLTSDGPVTVEATEASAKLTAFGNQKLECAATYTVGNVNSTSSPGVHKPLILPTSALTIIPHYTKCSAYINNVTQGSATVTMNGCDFVLNIGVKSGTKYPGTVDIICEVGKEIEVHVYSSVAHTTSVCTYKIPAQKGLVGGFAENSGENVKLGGPVTGIKVSKTGILCGGTKEETGATQDIETEAKGTNGEGKATKIEVTG